MSKRSKSTQEKSGFVGIMAFRALSPDFSVDAPRQVSFSNALSVHQVKLYTRSMDLLPNVVLFRRCLTHIKRRRL